MTDSFIGLSMLDVGKTSTLDVLEEAVAALQRAHHFFSSPVNQAMRWKVLYYLSVAALHISNSASDIDVKINWRDLAVRWAKSSDADLSALELGSNGASSTVPSGYGDLSPGLNRQALDALKKALGIRPAKDKGRNDLDKDKDLDTVNDISVDKEVVH